MRCNVSIQRNIATRHDFLLLIFVACTAMSGDLSGAGGEGEMHSPDQEIQIAEARSQGHTTASTSTDRRRSYSAQARKSLESPKTDHTPTAPQLSPKDRFRAAVRKVITVHRTYSIVLHRRLGAEPGVDPHRHSTFAAYRNVRQRCVIDIVDYSSLRCSFGRMTNSGFIKFLQNDQPPFREPWVKVRWINVGGISWDVISALALKYGNTRLHGYPLRS